MPKYTKKQVIIEAHQWFKNGDHPRDGMGSTEGLLVRYFRHPDTPGPGTCEQCKRIMHDHGWIDTPEGGHIVCPGDFIITGEGSEHYPCKSDIFVKDYNLIEENYYDRR